MTKLKNKIEDYTEQEFIHFVTDICLVNAATEVEHQLWVNHFRAIIEHPFGDDLIFYPQPDADSSPEGIVNTIKQWRAENGKPGFKVE
ncbi:Colicin immunity protein [Pseudomonas cichorii]|uniref:Colicin immunity protein n=1 Tax=Pseudomonas cichorii TaxID=36746 RepID=A0A3M4LV30_PSECI|nr:bacteriocin immunity protein [Pseudomonas cichorii]RMQ44881.1 Colicin immunity protein [Pseudomonas cichorii]